MKPLRILVVDDETLQRETLGQILSEEGYVVKTAHDSQAACEWIAKEAFNVILTDFRMPVLNGLDVAKKAAQLNPQAAVLMMTAYADVQNVIESFQAGVVDYLLKPIQVESLLRKILSIKEHVQLKQEVFQLRKELSKKHSSNRLLGDSLVMRAVRELIEQIADSKGSVLIIGETGTGKEVAARQIHALSPRAQEKFIAINCGAIPENLLESELFGYKKGAFTGAQTDKEGLFVAADGGTLFLDEIGEMPKNLQVKLLRALQERRVTPVGSTEDVAIDVRIIAATNRDLNKEIEDNRFRRDLFYRINVVEVKMPALRERLDDIPVLVEHCIKKYTQEMGRPLIPITHQALQLLLCYSFPGNIRELENVIERAVILSKQAQMIDVVHLPASFNTLSASSSDVLALDLAISQFTKAHIMRVLEVCSGDKKESAKVLGLSLSSLYRKMEELDIHLKTGEESSDSLS